MPDENPANVTTRLEATLERLEVKDWTPEDGDTRCQHCWRPNPVWFADNDTWNATVGTPDNPRGDGTILCPTCFMRRAGGVWQVRFERPDRRASPEVTE